MIRTHKIVRRLFSVGFAEGSCLVVSYSEERALGQGNEGSLGSNGKESACKMQKTQV